LDYLLSSESTQTVFKLLKLLSTTDNMSYFQSPFIRRMINNQWFNNYRSLYKKVLLVTCATCFLNVVDIILINYDYREVCQARIGVNLLTTIPAVYALLRFELKKTRWTYAYYLAFACASILDGFSCWTVDYDPYDDDTAAERMLRARPTEDDSNREYTMLP
jgi:hypothetical protein